MKKENEKEGIAALDRYLEESKNPRTTAKPKEVEPKTDREKRGLEALDKYLEESKPLNQ